MPYGKASISLFVFAFNRFLSQYKLWTSVHPDGLLNGDISWIYTIIRLTVNQNLFAARNRPCKCLDGSWNVRAKTNIKFEECYIYSYLFTFDFCWSVNRHFPTFPFVILPIVASIMTVNIALFRNNYFAPFFVHRSPRTVSIIALKIKNLYLNRHWKFKINHQYVSHRPSFSIIVKHCLIFLFACSGTCVVRYDLNWPLLNIFFREFSITVSQSLSLGWQNVLSGLMRVHNSEF